MNFIFPFEDYIFDFLPIHLVVLALLIIVGCFSFMFLTLMDAENFFKSSFVIILMIVLELIAFSNYDSYVLRTDYNLTFQDLYIIKANDNYYLYQGNKASRTNIEIYNTLKNNGITLIDVDEKERAFKEKFEGGILK